MRVLGIDPGLTRCGLGVVEGRPGRALTHVDHRVARTSPDDDVADRLAAVADAVRAQILTFRPDAVAVERVFSQVNIKTVMGVAQASGVAILVAQQCDVPVVSYTPTEVKAAVTGSGRADKAQVQHMISRILRMDVKPSPADAADALAIATCHVWRGAATSRLADAARAAQAGVRR